MTFPSNPNDDDLHEAFGRKLRYRSGKWQVVSSPTVATVTEEAPKTEAVTQAVDLPMTGNEIGAMAYVQESNRLYIWNGSGWFEVALVNTNPTITAGGSATYELATDGTPTVITLTANDPEGIPLTWSYSVTSGSLGGTTVSNVDNVFTITPSTDTNDAGTFQLTFTASDGVNLDTSASSFTLSFTDWTSATLLHTLNNPNAYGTGLYDNFGQSVAISGNYAIVGAYQEGDAGGNYSGKAYIFNVTTGALVHTLDDPNAYGTSADDNFGFSVAIDGNYAIVGAWKEDDAGGLDSGKAYIFKTTTGDWTDTTLLYTLDNPNAYSTSAYDYFGWSVGISGNLALVSSYYEDDVNGLSSGKAYIFNVTTGALLHTLNNPNAYGTGTSDLFGNSIAISGNYVIIGAPYEDDATLVNAGKAYIFDVTTGTLVHTLNNPNPDQVFDVQDRFGWAVGISGNYATVSARLEEDGSGKAYVYDVTTGALLHTLNNPNAYSTPTNDFFGERISMSDNYAIISTTSEDDAGGFDSGKAYIFDVTNGILLKTLDNPNAYGTSDTDIFGNAVGISGNYCIVGARLEDDAGVPASGKAYIFQAG